MALRAFNSFQRRMLPEHFEFCRRIRSNEEVDFLSSAFPDQSQGMRAGACLQFGMQNVREWLLDGDGFPVEFQFAGRSGCDDVYLVARHRRTIGRPHDSGGLLSGPKSTADQSENDCSG